MGNRNAKSQVSFYVELEADLYSTDWVKSIRPVKMTTRSKPAKTQKSGNQIVKLNLSVPNAIFIDSIPEIAIEVPTEALTGITGEVAA